MSGLSGASREGFTLVELMVVIAIIAALISILLPSLKAVRTQTRVATSKVTLSVLETGIQQFEADSRTGGALPPSAPPILPGSVLTLQPGEVFSPHTSSVTPVVADGASLLFWALAGADLLGTPGFADVNGNGTWADDTAKISTPAGPQPLYAIADTGRPAVLRSGPFIDISKMKLPKLTEAGYEIPAAVGKHLKSRCLPSLCFLDAFGQPVLYYKANRNKPLMAGLGTAAENFGVYNMWDNLNITTGDGSCSLGGVCNNGLDFGHGIINSYGQHHYLADPGPGADDKLNATQIFSALEKPADRNFSRTIWNPHVTAVPRPHNDKSFILLSAGPDGVFGTADDAANFDVNK